MFVDLGAGADLPPVHASGDTNMALLAGADGYSNYACSTNINLLAEGDSDLPLLYKHVPADRRLVEQNIPT